MNEREKSLHTSLEQQIEIKALGQSLADGSDFLTREVYRYVQFGDPIHFKNFWLEVNVTRSRDKAVQRLQELKVLPSELAYIEKAKRLSDNLINTEIDAMDAVARNDFATARKLVFGKHYDQQKKLIAENIKKFQSLTTSRAHEISKSFHNEMSLYMALTNFLLILSGALIFFLVYFIGINRLIRPLKKLTESMKELAAGNLVTQPVISEGNDEISEMEAALDIFRENAIKRNQAEKELQEEKKYTELMREVAVAANELGTFEEVAKICLTSVCQATGWPVGHLYLFDDEKQKLITSRIWHTTDKEKFEEFVSISEKCTFVSGTGLPGRVLASGQTVWVGDVTRDDNFPRARLAGEIGVRSAFAFPAMIGEKVVAVAEFYTSEIKDPHDKMLQAMNSVGLQIGRVIERQRSQATLQRHLANLESLVQERTRELERSNEELSDFASIASHDLNEPLRKITTFGDRLLERMDQEDPKNLDYLRRMRKAARRMQELINNLLGYSMVSRQPRRLVPINLNKIVAESLLNLESRLDETQGTVHVDDLPEIEADPIQMCQLFQNLVGNSLKYHKESVAPVVNISCRFDSEDMVVITIEDNGIGFNENHSQRIFRPFQRLHTQNHFQGTGMGLAICKKIVDRHKGSIQVKSTPNEGSTFIVHLPLKKTYQTETVKQGSPL